MPREHVRKVHKPGEHCRETDHPGTCWVCNLFLCDVCGALEGALLPECPGKKLTEEEHEVNYRHYCNGTGPFAKGSRRHVRTLLNGTALGPVSKELFDLSKPAGACAYSPCIAQAKAGEKYCPVHDAKNIIERAKQIVTKRIEENPFEPAGSLLDAILMDLEGTI